MGEAYIRDLIESKKLDSAFCLIDLPEIALSIAKWRELYLAVQPLFPIAASMDKVVLRALNSLGVSFSACTQAELKYVSTMPVVDTSVARSNKYIQGAVEAGIRSFVIYTVSDVEKIATREETLSAIVDREACIGG